MRMNLTAHSSQQFMPAYSSVPVSLMLKPSCGLPGDYSYATDSQALLKMLKQQTDLPSTVLETFMTQLRCSPSARLLGVDLDDRILHKIGYFVD